jgi:hypothetical protein
MKGPGVRRVVLGILLLPLAANAGEPARQRVEIIPDQEKGEVRFVIDGQRVMRVTSQSIIVSGDVIYSGFIQDTGSSR